MNQHFLSEVVRFVQAETSQSLYWVGAFLAPSVVVIGLIGKLPDADSIKRLAKAVVVFSWAAVVTALMCYVQLSNLETKTRRQLISFEYSQLEQSRGVTGGDLSGNIELPKFDGELAEAAFAEALTFDSRWQSNWILWEGLASAGLSYLGLLLLIIATLDHRKGTIG